MLKNHPRITEMEADFQLGLSKAQIAAKYLVSKWAVGRHFRKASKPETLESQIEKWKLRGDRLWTIAADNSDARGMALAVQSGLRGLEMQLKRSQEIAELTQQSAPGVQLTLDDIDAIVSGYAAESSARADAVAIESAKRLRDNAARFDPQETPKQRLESSHRALVYHDLFSMLEACNENPDLRTATLEFAARWQQKENKPDDVIQQRTVTHTTG